MPALDWLRNRFRFGYSSGNILVPIPGPIRLVEEAKIAGSYREVFRKAVLPYLAQDSRVLELGPERGSWTRAILKHRPRAQVTVVDFQDVAKWLKPERYDGRLICLRVSDNSFSTVEDGSFDFMFSFGVLCHNDAEHIREILRNSLPKMKREGIAAHQYGDWNKLAAYGWRRGGIPARFQQQADDEIWWPRNTRERMSAMATETGWTILCPDLDLVRRDGIIVLQRRRCSVRSGATTTVESTSRTTRDEATAVVSRRGRHLARDRLPAPSPRAAEKAPHPTIGPPAPPQWVLRLGPPGVSLARGTV